MTSSLGPWFDYTVNGLVVGNIYALLAVGLALIYGVSHLINFAHGSIYSPKFLELGGNEVNGVLTTVPFFPDDPRPVVQAFVKNFEKKFGAQPDAYNGRAYDTIILLGAVMRQFGTDRKAIKEGLGKIKDVPSVVYGKVTFDTEARRVANPFVSRIEVKDGKWAAYEGGKVMR